ncbi:PREDICTED: kinesin-like protein KIF6 isoform X2 [Priapulus caudatus]|nr:PREDICTED: kinesin-like protein KIF6 isoform X2 [Priapulus caudatus]
MEDSSQNIHLRNLSMHPASSEEEALNLLFLGDTNRMIAETPMNQASTRSHCIFTVHITARQNGSATLRKAKLNLVDLAGSERVYKSNVVGQLLTEAKYINLSLHYLEQVIIALSERSRSHVPYRNSMMTSMLRDSLGGNCMTTMLANLACDTRNLEETISTCRFSQRVAMIKNEVVLNEELDPLLLISQLKKENQLLKDELTLVNGAEWLQELNEDEKLRCTQAVKSYVEDQSTDEILDVGADMRMILLCFSLLKNIIKDMKLTCLSKEKIQTAPCAPIASGEYTMQKEDEKLKDLLQQRNSDITILTDLLKNARHGPDGMQVLTSTQLSEWTRRKVEVKRGTSGDSPQDSGQLREAFTRFRKEYKHEEEIESKKMQLRTKYAEAKALGEQVNQARNLINDLKCKLQKYQMSRAMQGFNREANLDSAETDAMETSLRAEMQAGKCRYKEKFQQLRGLKAEIEHLHHLLEKSRVKIQQEFETWWSQQGNAMKDEAVSPRVGSSWVSRNEAQSCLREKTRRDCEQTTVAATSTASLDAETVNSAEIEAARPPHSAVNIPLTGDSQADADIIAFFKARQRLVQCTNIVKR